MYNLDQSAIAGAAIGTVLAVSIILAIAWYILMVIADWKIFTKAGIPGWKALIPIYNVYLSFKLADFSPWWFLVTIVLPAIQPIVKNDIYTCISSIIVAVIIIVWSVKLGTVFNKGTGFKVGLVFLPSIFQLILAFGSSKYVGHYRPKKSV